MIKRQSLIKFAATLTMLVVFTAGFPGLLQASPQPRLYWGAYISGSAYGINPATGQTYSDPPWDMTPWNLLEAHAGKKMSIFHWGQPWYATNEWPQGYFPFPATLATKIRSRGAIPMLDWASYDLSAGTSALNQPKFSLASIINGAHDAYIQKWAADAKAWGYPMFLRFDWEMNGNWFPWSEQVNGNAPGMYVAAWRHVHDIFTAAGANNITWVWAPNIASNGNSAMSELYPGDAYVDWTGLDAYNKYDTWQSSGALLSGGGLSWLQNSYQQLLAVAPAKPVMLAEFASLEAGDGGAKKAAWITDAFTSQIPAHFPAIKAVLWFQWNSDPGSSFVIESSAASRTAFAAAIGSSTYAANEFGSLPLGAKIQPLGDVQPAGTATPTHTTPTATSTVTAHPVKTTTPAPTVTKTKTPTPIKTTTPAPTATKTHTPVATATKTNTATPVKTQTSAPTVTQTPSAH